MRNRTKNFRRHAGEDDSDDDTTTGTTAPSTGATAPARKLPSTKEPSSRSKTLLSFADEEYGSEAKTSHDRVKTLSSSSSRLTKPKSSISASSSHKLTSSRDRASSSSITPSFASNVQPQAGEYTKEKLLELQKNTRTLTRGSSTGSGTSTSRPQAATPSPEPVILLKGLVKPVNTKEEARGIGKIEKEADEGRKLSSFRREKDDAENRLANLGIERIRSADGDDESGPLIPDQATINAIRARRERLRQSRAAAPDYISLDGGSGNHGAGEELSDEEPEFRGRIALLGEKTDAKKGVFESDVDGRMEGMVDGGVLKQNGDYDDEDEEDKIWEEEQFRKGLGKRMDDGSTRVNHSVSIVSQSVQQKSYAYPTIGYPSVAPNVSSTVPAIGGSVGVSRSVEVMSISQQADVATKALQDSIRRLKESHGRTMSSMNRTEENLSASLANITALETSLSDAGEKYTFMQKLRDFISVICDFLQDKAPYIEELEDQMQKLHEERASAIAERRAADNADEMMEVEAAVNAAMSVLKGGGSSALVAAAATAAQAASAAAREQSNLPVQLDEFGRDVNLQKRMDNMRRAEARKRRKAQSEARKLSSARDSNAIHRIEGESSTDESDSEKASYQSNRDSLLQTADHIFSDASEEYSQLAIVKERFESWKKQYSSSYRDAYMSLSAPTIFSPYVRLELLKWDPIHEEADFNDMQWHSLLFDYGVSENGGDFEQDDADANLVPSLVEKVAIPILHHQIANCWDLLSTRGTKNAVSATTLVINYVPASSEALQELLVAIRTRLSDAIADLNVPTWSPLVMKAVPNSARVAAYRFGVSIRLLRNICLWKDILALPVLEQLALEELLGRKLLPHIRSIKSNTHDAITRTERIIASLFGVWAGPSVTGDRSSKLQPLVDYILTLGKTIEKKHVSGVNEIETSGLARRLKKMLVELNEYDMARAISRMFQLKEAL